MINDGIQSCSKCGKTDHYKSGLVADHSDDDEETKCEKCNEKGILMYNDILCVWCAKKD